MTSLSSQSNRLVDRELNRQTHTVKRKSDREDNRDDDNGNGGSRGSGGKAMKSSHRSEESENREKKPSFLRRVLSALPLIAKKLPLTTSFESSETNSIPILSDTSDSLRGRAKSYGLWGSSGTTLLSSSKLILMFSDLVRRQEQKRQEAVQKKRSFALMGVLSTSTVYEFLSNLHIGALHPVMNHLLGSSK